MAIDHESRGGWSDPPGAVELAASGDDPVAPEARYVVGAYVGRGGMGVVHSARDLRLDRDVALKAARPEGVDAPGGTALWREARIAARLDHPAVVAVHDIGRLPDGRHFYVMRLVRGRSLAQRLADGEGADPVGRRALLRHLLVACEAVGHAHGVGLVHRDLKPSNILTGPHGETQVVDWGLAAPTIAAAARWTDLVGPSPPPGGTPGYTAAEQAAGAPPDPRQDVWSLGALLYAVLAHGPDDPALAAIAQRAQAPDPEARYPEAQALADDLARWFDGRRVLALRYGPLDWTRWAWRAWRVPLTVAAIGATLVLAAVAMGWWRTARARDVALAAQAQAAQVLRTLRRDEAVRATIANDRARALAMATAVLEAGPDPVARGVRAAFERQPGARRIDQRPAPACGWVEWLPDGDLICGDGQGVARVDARGEARWRAKGVALGGVVRAAADQLQVWDGQYTTRLLDLRTGAEQAILPYVDGDWLPHEPPRRPGGPMGLLDPTPLPPSGCALQIKAVAVAADGKVAALCSDGRLLLARPGDAETTAHDTPLVGEHMALALAWLPDGRLVAGSLRGRLVRFGPNGRIERVVTTSLGSLRRLVPSPDGRWVAAAGSAPGVALWAMGSGAVAEVVETTGRVRAFGFEDARTLDLVGREATARYRLPGDPPRLVQGSAGLADCAVIGGGAWALLAAGDGEVLQVDLHTGAVVGVGLGDGVVKAVGDGPWGPWASGMFDPPLVRLTPEGPRPVVGGRRLRRGVALPDGSLVGIGVHAGLFRWTAPDEAPARLGEGPFADLTVGEGGWLTLDREGGVARWQVGHPAVAIRTLPGARALAAAAGRIAILTADGVRWWVPGSEDRLIPAGDAPAVSLALSADGARLAIGDLLGEVRVHALPDGQLEAVLPGHTERVAGLTFLPDGDLMSVSWDGTARLWALP